MADITFTIPADKIAEFKVGFLKACPVPVDEMGDPTMSELDWIKEWSRRQFLQAYRDGKTQLANESIVIENGLILIT
jgi:hypothetical protein